MRERKKTEESGKAERQSMRREKTEEREERWRRERINQKIKNNE